MCVEGGGLVRDEQNRNSNCTQNTCVVFLKKKKKPVVHLLHFLP